MKKIFIPLKYEKINFSEVNPEKLPKRIGLATTVQYLDSIEDLKAHLERHGKEAIMLRGNHSLMNYQVLGCDTEFTDKNSKDEIDAILFLGDGYFHPNNIKMKTNKDVYLLDPKQENIKITRLESGDIEKIMKKKKGSLLKFLNSKNIGVIQSIKPGQKRKNLEKDIQTLKERFKDKKFYIFIADTISFDDFENFSFIECWINTSCPRLAVEDSQRIRKPILNIEDLDMLDEE